MSDTVSPRSRTGRAMLAVGVAGVLLLGGHSTLAFWTKSASVNPGTIKAGSVDLKVNGLDGDTGFTTLGLSGMQPGDTTAAIITVKNGGLSPLTYTVDAAATNTDGKNLRSVLVVKVTTASAVTGTGHARTCAGTAISGSATSFTTGLVPAARSLAAGAQETLCVQATLPNAAPISTTTTYQSASTAVTFALHASQVIS